MRMAPPQAKRERKMQEKIEREVFGVTYDRYVLLKLHSLIVRDYGLETVVEMPSHGAKAAGSLYSIGFGIAGCSVTLVNPEMEMMWGWDRLGIKDRVKIVSGVDVCETAFEDETFDLAWNFVTWTELNDPLLYLREIKRVSRKYVLLVTCNNFQPGYPWHRLIHRFWGYPWTHGNVAYNHMTRVKRLFRAAGLKVAEYGAIDTPGWPDPSGPRDIRLHKNYAGPSDKPRWEVPMIDYIYSDSYPAWMRALGRWDMGFRKGLWKLPLSHLFYVLGK
jgi:hypothetical protein